LKNSMKGETDGKVRDMYQADFSMLSDESREKIAKTDEGVDRMSSLLDDLKVRRKEMQQQALTLCYFSSSLHSRQEMNSMITTCASNNSMSHSPAQTPE